jgi:hypothetical protein
MSILKKSFGFDTFNNVQNDQKRHLVNRGLFDDS